MFLLELIVIYQILVIIFFDNLRRYENNFCHQLIFNGRVGSDNSIGCNGEWLNFKDEKGG